VFIYAGLGSIAPAYSLPKAPRAAATSGMQAVATSGQASQPTPGQAATAGGRLPLTLRVKAPARPTAAHTAVPRGAKTGSAGGRTRMPTGASESVPAGTGKVRLFAHPGNPDALASAASAAASARLVDPRSGRAGHPLPLRRGSVVAKGTVLGHVRVPLGARDGHLRFAIRPAGDQGTVDPRPILQSWVQLDAALHPQGARGETELLGATASGVFLLSKSELEGAVLSDPGIGIYPCGRKDVASGAVDKRVLVLLAFLSRIGLKPTVSALRCGHSEYAASGSVAEHYAADAVDISQINGIPIAGHQGAGTITDRTIRALLTLQGEFVPHQIISLMRYPGASNTQATPGYWNHIRVGFRPARATVTLSPTVAARTAHSAGSGRPAPSPMVVSDNLDTTQWNQLMMRIAGLPTPTVAVKPSSSALRDPNGLGRELPVKQH
jgi:hypothetical protein